MKQYKFKINGNEYNVAINSVEGQNASVTVNGTTYQVELADAPVSAPVQPVATPSPVPQAEVQAPSSAPSGSGKPVTSPLPGVIIAVKVNVGDKVRAGQEVAVLEAMKMENNINADRDGKVVAVQVAKGDTVADGAALIVLE